jgi:hypothetical protein
VVLTLLTLAVAGVTRALVIEKPFAWWRDWVRGWNGVTGNVTYLVHCPFCTGFWVGVAMTWLNYHHHANPLWLSLLTVWAIFAVAPHIADR